jgi:hypothetical protein
MKYYTLVHFSYARSKEGAQRYTRIDGKIPLWRTYDAAKTFRDTQGYSKWNNFVHTLELEKLRRDHILMEETSEVQPSTSL